MIDKLKSLLPYIGALVVFMVLSFTYFSPVLENKELPQLDETHAIGMAQEIKTFESETGGKTQWTNSMFGGMPAYQIKGDASKNIFSYFNRFSRFGLPYKTVAILFLYMLGFYVFLLSLKMDKWLSLIGAVAFAFGSYNLIIIIAGHITKAYTIALMAPVVAGVMFAYNRNKWIGGLFTTVALGLQIAYNHVQITYYLAMLVGIIVISKFVYALIEKKVADFGKVTGVLVIAAVLAVLPNITNLWTTYEYGKYSIRGKSDLQVAEGEKVHSGLDKDYALAWSLEPKGTWTLLVPNAVGGASEAIGNNKDALKAVEQQFKEAVAGQSQYWGGRVFTSGPVYAGAIICFLFLLGAFYFKGKDKWWLIVATIFSFFLAWGKHFPGFTDFMFYHFPLYNKFRTVEMSMVIASFTIPTLGFLGLKEVLGNPKLVKEESWKFMVAFGLTGGISLLFYLFPAAFFDFISEMELSAILQQKQQYIQQNAAQAAQVGAYFDGLLHNLKVARIVLLKADAFRSFAFILIASASIWFFVTNKVPKKYLLWGLGLLVIVDLWSVDKRYLNNDHFQSKRKVNQSFELTPSDIAINSKKAEGDRVFTVYKNPFNEVNTSYHHHSIGGFHGAKLRRYQDVIEHYLEKDWQTIIGMLQKQGDSSSVQQKLGEMPVLNMLNGKFIVYNPNAEPIINNNTLGSVWFVEETHPVGSADAAIDAIGYVDLKNKAVVNTEEFPELNNYKVDSVAGNIELVSYAPNKLEYKYQTNQDQVAVFSQIYYPKGWKAYLDGKQIDICRANYILRAVKLPSGSHDLVFKFEPGSYKAGQMLALISSLIVLLLIAFAGYKYYRK
ncbi:YfhO family protein [Plebeiibacterium marinum]|uniref:YfhO family protein n=1 Tax=Plebeiibacterium marinum TaxID=2992111 RepID=A0AAE3SL21_9BACT|nr:YfhO family protein [Plebeiobacterium marinum]MCW3806110.1 YfhO family protein [Plebeiobacterium marinum]